VGIYFVDTHMKSSQDEHKPPSIRSSETSAKLCIKLFMRTR